MDFVKKPSSWPSFKNNQSVRYLKNYKALFNANKMEAANYLNRNLADLKIKSNTFLHDALIIILKSEISSVSIQDVPNELIP